MRARAATVPPAEDRPPQWPRLQRRPASLIGPHAAVTPRVRSRLDHSSRRDSYQCGSRSALPARPRADFVAATRKIRNHRLRSSIVQLQIAWIHRMIIEARHKMPCFEARRLDRLLGVHPEQNHVEKELNQRLLLVVAAR